MPDCHAGAGCVIGTTMTITDKVIPNLVGVDIGCGMLATKLKEQRINLPKFDSVSQAERKGSVSAMAGERLLIPMNMRDGALICIGKGNPDWNESAPHGAGRLMSRSEARSSISMKDYKKAMEGIYTSCVSRGTIDESPFAYKPMDEIMANIEPTAEIISHIRPIYNFKAGGDED